MLLPKKRCTIFIITISFMWTNAVDLVGDEVGGNDPHVEVRFFHLWRIQNPPKRCISENPFEEGMIL